MVFRRHSETGNVTLFQLNRYQVSPVHVSLPPSYSKSENAMLFKLNSHQVSPFPISPPSCSTLIQTSLRKLMIKKYGIHSRESPSNISSCLCIALRLIMRHEPPHALIQTMTRHTKSELTVGSPKSVTIDWLELKKLQCYIRNQWI
jgi:hypothetical protein